MALEDKIDALIVALDKNTAALGASVAMREEVLAIANAAISGEAAAAPAPKAAAKAAAAPKAEAPKEEPKPEPVAEAPDAYAGLKEMIAEYLGVERPEERKARQDKVIALLNHEKIKKADLPADAKPDTMNIAPEAIGLFKSQITLLKEKGDLTTPASDALV